MPATIVRTLSFYRHPKTGRRVPATPAKEKEFRAWFRRQKRLKGRRPVREHWLYTFDGAPLAQGGRRVPGQKYLRFAAGQPLYRVQLKHKMTQVEKILPLSGLTDRHIRDTFNNKEVFRNIWNNWGGVIRIAVSGYIADKQVGSRRVREVFHLGYHKEHWEIQQKGRGKRAVAGRELFRRWLVSSVSSNLRRRGFRLSNPKESALRVGRLRDDLGKLQGQTEYIGYMHKDRMSGHVQQMVWKAEAIRKQMKTKQLRGATIRIEKLI